MQRAASLTDWQGLIDPVRSSENDGGLVGCRGPATVAADMALRGCNGARPLCAASLALGDRSFPAPPPRSWRKGAMLSRTHHPRP